MTAPTWPRQPNELMCLYCGKTRETFVIPSGRLPWLHRSRPGLLPRGSSYTAPRWPSAADVPQAEGEV